MGSFKPGDPAAVEELFDQIAPRYDLLNDLKQGRGRLVITNINGETDPGRIRELLKSGQFFRYGFMK